MNYTAYETIVTHAKSGKRYMVVRDGAYENAGHMVVGVKAVREDGTTRGAYLTIRLDNLATADPVKPTLKERIAAAPDSPDITEYEPVDLADAREGDEVLGGNGWHPIKSASLHKLSSGEVIHVVYPSGSTRTYPTSHGIKLRRAARPAESVAEGNGVNASDLQTFAADLNTGTPGYGQIHRAGCSHRFPDPYTFLTLPTRDNLNRRIEELLNWTPDEWTLAGCTTVAEVPKVTARYEVRYSRRFGDWYIADTADNGECVSGTYGTEAAAAEALAEGKW